MIRVMILRALGAAAVLAAIFCALSWRAEADEAQTQATLQKLARSFESDVQPLLQRYCYECHSADVTEADIDLQEFQNIEQVRAAQQVWLKVAEMLDTRQMPPKDSAQLEDNEHAQLHKWVRDYLTFEAASQAGDPGPVVLRRLSNSEYTYTLRDLTGVASLDPAREFPVDGAAGEGFTNAGSALVMSPALLVKYLDAAKEVASHAVLLPDGIRFSEHTTRRDLTDEMLQRIRQSYSRYTESKGGEEVNLQGLVFNTNEGGRLPVERYLLAALNAREALDKGTTTPEQVAEQQGLSPKYMAVLWKTLHNSSESGDTLLLDHLRAQWKNAKADDTANLTGHIEQWQRALWKFNTVGIIGRAGGPTRWLEPITPLAGKQDFSIKLPDSPDGQDIVIYLAATDAGDGNAADYVVWKDARLEGGAAPIPLRDVRGIHDRLTTLREETLHKTEQYLAAAAEAQPNADVAQLAATHGLNAQVLAAWLEYLAINPPGPVVVEGRLPEKIHSSGQYNFIQGWGLPDLPTIMANSSDEQVRIPGIARPHSVIAHPTPTMYVAAGWQSPIEGDVRIEANVVHAHPECGNGVQWIIQHRSGSKAVQVAEGEINTGGQVTTPSQTISVRRGDLVSLIIGPRQENHSCDLTEINLVITQAAGEQLSWNLANDVSGDILAGNPHADRHGNAGIWHFYRGAMSHLLNSKNVPVTVAAGSALEAWQQEKAPEERRQLAERIQALANGSETPPADSPDAQLVTQLKQLIATHVNLAKLDNVQADERFGTHPAGGSVAATDLVVQAPSVVELRLPAELAAGRELVVSGQLEPRHGSEGSVQLQVTTTKPDEQSLVSTRPVIVTDGSAAHKRWTASFESFRNLFPAALCYTKIVPVDEVVTLTLFYREDDHLKRLMLDEQQIAEIDRLWDELLFISQEPLALVTAYEQITEFATQDRPDLVEAFKPLEKPIKDRAAAFRQRLIDSEPAQLEAVLKLADRAWRRPLVDEERQDLVTLYQQLRASELPHDEALRLTLARILTSPAFLYRIETPPSGDEFAPISDVELATRLSYFLWSSMPDDELRRAAEAGKLSDQRELVSQMERMLRDGRTRRLAIEFACQWLHIREFDRKEEKNENLYPEFATLRTDMYEESIRFFEDMFRNDGSILDIYNADHTFLNETLAKLYGIEAVQGDEWRRVENVREHGRGGILAMATVLASQSGASRTSPILRGTWVSETLLGERLPRPPPDVPLLPDNLPSGLTERQLTEMHSALPGCAKCHDRIDPYGFSLEQYDTIGRLRAESVDTKTTLLEGKMIEGIDGLRDYLVNDRQDDVLRQFCRKLLGYALGREVQLSDQPLLAEMQSKLAANNYRFSVAVEAIVTSPQFRMKRSD